MSNTNKNIEIKSIEKRSIPNFLNNEVKSYAKYVLENRALPNIMDGMRVGARKTLYAAMTGDVSKKTKVKMLSLVGDIYKLHYSHGDASLLNTITQLSMDHVYGYPPLYIIGQIPTLRESNVDTAARYLHVKKTKNLDIFKTDKELWEIKIEDGEPAEPKFFLPVIPITLLYRTNAPGFGLGYRCFSYDLNTIVDNCILAINEGSCANSVYQKILIPKVKGIDQSKIVYNKNKESWYNLGDYELDFDNDLIVVRDLPYHITHDSYKNNLEKMLDKNLIHSYQDLCLDGKTCFSIKLHHGRLKLMYDNKWKFFGDFKLYKKIPKNNLNVIDEDGKTILRFDTPYELIDSFVQKRLKYYGKRKTKTINVLSEKISKAEMKIKFVELVIDEKLIINKRPIQDIKKDLDKYGLDHEMLKIKIDRLTKDEIENKKLEIENLKSDLEYIRKTTIQDMYIFDLIDFKEKFSKVEQINN